MNQKERINKKVKNLEKYFKFVQTQQCEIPGCDNKAMGWSGTKKDGSIRLTCSQENCPIFCKTCGANPYIIEEYKYKKLCDKCKSLYNEEIEEWEMFEK